MQRLKQEVANGRRLCGKVFLIELAASSKKPKAH